MTFQDLFSLLIQYKPLLLGIMLFAPWVALAICVVIPGQKEEPFVLSFNLGMALLSLVLAVGYLLFATNNGGWARVMKEADILLMLAPCYYVVISFWVTKQRLPLSQVPVARMVQGLALIAAGYLGLAWMLKSMRIVIFSYIPFQYLVFLLLGLTGIMYFGYLRVTGADTHKGKSRMEDELNSLRRKDRF
ncbi:hypothetical protein [Acaryochloris sp. IP29b_bin.137]|uniref:hypothetical protein n=1 Tax=Acaryochloris sp. IP29b_bin.137 TaxID=2969217 RepID=UPI00260EAA61|nr:hypothetical protein [Acaryochloris sp. IP29b_bin.137]